MTETALDTEEQPPGFIAKVEVIGNTYTDLVSGADTEFRMLFRDHPWAWVGAQIEPHEQEQGFGGERIITWKGTFFAITTEVRDK